MKVILMLADGMRPDALSDVPAAQKIMKETAYTLNAGTVFPSVTLPCHVSLFHSVTPERHGTTTNIYMPQVRPILGLCEVLKNANKRSAIFYNWEDLRDVSRPNSLTRSSFYSGRRLGYKEAGEMITDEAIDYLKKFDTDFTFVYFGLSDWAGHNFGWMSEEYIEALRNSWANMEKIMQELGDEEYTYIITSDHGGHDRTHGFDIPEDMTIPIFIKGKDFEAGSEIGEANIIDIAPTIVKLLGLSPDEDWEGRSLI